MSKFNVRPIPPPPPPIVSVPRDKKPSAYEAMKHPTTNVLTHVSVLEEPKKKGRPSKEDVRKHKLAMASASIAILMTDKPTRKKIHEYMERRILELEMEKR